MKNVFRKVKMIKIRFVKSMLLFYGRTSYTILNEFTEKECDIWIDRSSEDLNCELKNDLSKMNLNEQSKIDDWSVLIVQ